MTHKDTAISNPTPLLLNARDSSNIMPAYPIAKNSAIAIFCSKIVHKDQKQQLHQTW